MTNIRMCLRLAGLVFAFSSAAAIAAQNPIDAGAQAACAGKGVAEISAALGKLGLIGKLPDDKVAEAFGQALYLADLGHCVSPQAIVDAFAAFKKGKDAQTLDVAFAAGHMNGSHDGEHGHGGHDHHERDDTGSPGDPPSGH